MTTITRRLARLEAGDGPASLQALAERAARAEDLDARVVVAEAERILAEIEAAGETAEEYLAREWRVDVATARARVDAFWLKTEATR